MTNPLLENEGLPAFSQIRPEHVEPAIKEVLAANRAAIEQLVQQGPFTWDSLIVPLERLGHRLSRIWSPVGHLNAVRNDENLRTAYNNCLARLSDYATQVSQDERLYKAFLSVRNEQTDLTAEQQRLLDLELRDFRLAGVALEGEAQQRFGEIRQQLTRLQSRFEEHLLDCSNAWRYHSTDEKELSGIPDHALLRARERAQKEDRPGWLFTLDYPAFDAVMSHADNTQLREHFYKAWVTRASLEGPHAARYDNSEVMAQILNLRHELAALVGFGNYAEYSLATKMAGSIPEVMTFLHDLAGRSKPVAQKELAALEDFAGREMNPWDVGYYSEKLRKHRFGLSDEILRPYFPVERALAGMFEVVHKLYDVEVSEREDLDTWHPDVRFFDVHDRNGRYRGGFYTDLFTRQSKRGGAWMDECVNRMRIPGHSADPIAYLNCNFTPPASDHPALLTHNEVVTLFHEFGHVLHHIMTQVDFPSVAGINGVAWDAVELPSQFMENFCWNRKTLPLISGHFETGEPLPEALFDRLLGSRRFQAGLGMVRQLEFAMFDMRLHAEYDGQARIHETLEEVRDEVAVLQAPSYNRFPNSFSHVFGGGYAAGYYSYKWAEVLSADAFAAFEQAGVLDTATGSRFLQSILQRGGGVDAMQAFVEFRGRKPQLDALLRHSGLEDQAAA